MSEKISKILMIKNDKRNLEIGKIKKMWEGKKTNGRRINERKRNIF